MSLDRSLKAANSLIRHRNVLTRGERLIRLGEEEKWNETKGVFGLPKVANRKAALAKAEKEEGAEGTTPAAGAAAPAAAAGAKGAAGAKAAAPAAGAKGAAPAAGAKGAAAPAAKAPAAKKK
jgi:small basic protein (TIGR04137 family)